MVGPRRVPGVVNVCTTAWIFGRPQEYDHAYPRDRVPRRSRATISPARSCFCCSTRCGPTCGVSFSPLDTFGRTKLPDLCRAVPASTLDRRSGAEDVDLRGR